jgi:membrane-associated protease RseP (regulator of RpoE activity)
MNGVGSEQVVDVYQPRPYPPVVAERRPRRLPLIHIVLFVTTFVTTALAGAFNAGANPFGDPASIRAGFPFAVTLLGILLIHELGHYTLAKVHNVRASLPYFLPGPPIFIGTFGAFIRLKSLPESRRALFDVGAAGPWAGLLVAIPAVIVGLRLSEVRPAGLGEGGMILGDSMLFSLLTRLALGRTPDEVTILLHPVALAGWIGLFVTVLNLLPMGQLDGGHVTYAMFGRKHRWIARLALATIAMLAYTSWPGWFVWVILPLAIGIDHPPTLEDNVPLRGWRRWAGWLTIAVFVLLFMPAPFSEAKPAPEFEGQRTAVKLDQPSERVSVLEAIPL